MFTFIKYCINFQNYGISLQVLAQLGSSLVWNLHTQGICGYTSRESHKFKWSNIVHLHLHNAHSERV